VFVVTGGSSGIGAATVARLAGTGTVVVIDIQPPRYAAPQVEHLALDVSDAAAVQSAIAGILGRHGRIDGLVTCAGIGSGAKRFGEYAIDEWQRVLDVNLMGTMYTVRAALPSMLARGRGAIVTIGSSFGVMGRDTQAPYATSKAAVIHLTRCLAIDLGSSGVRANCVCPGLTDTPLTGFLQDPALKDLAAAHHALHAFDRAGKPDEIADVIVFLLSDQARLVHGQAISVDGGYSAGKWLGRPPGRP
jgi:meso-butanediol dehydrogenase/(S,S)-butanediol dehydrogenase/diacetyl reductase